MKAGKTKQSDPEDSKSPKIDLVSVPHGNGELVTGWPAFFLDSFNDASKMRNSSRHPQTGEVISFRLPTIAESISVVAYKFVELIKSRPLAHYWLNLGLIVRTPEGIIANPSVNDVLGQITDASLKRQIDTARRVNGIYLGDKDFGFAPFESFKQGVQDCDTFTTGGLARILQHTDGEQAWKLKIMASRRNYDRGVNVYAFGPTNEPSLKVVRLYSGRESDVLHEGKLIIDGGFRDSNGYTFGILDSGKKHS